MDKKSKKILQCSFRDGRLGDRTAVVLRGVASRTCSIQLAAFLCNCRQAFSLYVLLASR